jgi:lipopolysaccharide export LptBFGC system permease protein LptF
MIIKTRYTLSSFLKVFFIVSVSFLLMFFFIEILESMKDVVKHGESFNSARALYSLPSIFVEISPVLTFLSGMFLLGEMIKYGEVRILEISGIKPVKIFTVLCICGVAVSSLAFCMKNYTAPVLLKRLNNASEIKMVNFSTPRYLLYSESFSSPDTFRQIQISEIIPDGGIVTVNAGEAVYLGENLWRFTGGRTWAFSGEGGLESSRKFETLTMRIMLEPDLVIDTSKNIDEFTYPELRVLMRKMEALKILPAAVHSAFHERIAYPLLNLFFLFILFPFFYVRKKISRVFVLGLAVLLSFISYGIFSSGITLARAGKIPVFLGAWLVHILILAGVLAYFFKLSKRPKSDTM